MIHSNRFVSAALALALSAVAIAGCSKKDTSTNPPGGNGGELDSGDLATHATYQNTFAAVDTFPYHCEIHSSMHGKVFVRTGSPAAAAVTINDFNFSPDTIAVGPGGTVTWTNHGVTHTVTSD